MILSGEYPAAFETEAVLKDLKCVRELAPHILGIRACAMRRRIDSRRRLMTGTRTTTSPRSMRRSA